MKLKKTVQGTPAELDAEAQDLGHREGCNGSAAGTAGSRCRMSPPERRAYSGLPWLPTCELCVHVGDEGGCRVP